MVETAHTGFYYPISVTLRHPTHCKAYNLVSLSTFEDKEWISGYCVDEAVEGHEKEHLPEAIIHLPPTHVPDMCKDMYENKLLHWKLDPEFYFLVDKKSIERLTDWFDICASMMCTYEMDKASDRRSLRSRAKRLHKGIRAMHVYWSENPGVGIDTFRKYFPASLSMHSAVHREQGCLQSISTECREHMSIPFTRCSPCEAENCSRMVDVWNYFPPLPFGTILYQSGSCRFNIYHEIHTARKGDHGRFVGPINATYSPARAFSNDRNLFKIPMRNVLYVFILLDKSIRGIPNQLLYNDCGRECPEYEQWDDCEITIEPYRTFQVLKVEGHMFPVDEEWKAAHHLFSGHIGLPSTELGAKEGSKYHIIYVGIF